MKLAPLALLFAAAAHGQSFSYLGDGSVANGPLDFPMRGDFNGDGLDDVVVRGEAAFGIGMIVLRQTAPGAYSRRQIPNFNYHSDPQVADFDGDGRDDLVVGREELGIQLQVLFGQAGDGFDTVPLVGAVYPWVGAGEPRSYLALLDLEDDGDEDLVIFANSSYEVWRNDGSRQFSPLGLVQLPAGGFVRGPVGVDIDLDGRQDLAFTRDVGAESELFWIRSLGSGVFGAPQSLLPMMLPRTRRLKAADVDGDGDMDMVCLRTRPPSELESYWLRVDPGSTVTASRSHLPAGVSDLRISDVVDVDLDGVLDMVLYKQNGDRVILRRGIGQGEFETAAELTYSRTSLGGVVAVDIDFDGDLDLMTSLRDQWENTTEFGALVCAGTANSAGPGSSISLRGSEFAGVNQSTLVATGMPVGAFGLFLTSLDAASPTQVPGSIGTLCLGGAIGRFNRPGEILVAAPSGQLQLALDTTDIPDPLSQSVAITAPETRVFQLWYRDVQGTSPVSNFSSAVAVDFR